MDVLCLHLDQVKQEDSNNSQYRAAATRNDLHPRNFRREHSKFYKLSYQCNIAFVSNNTCVITHNVNHVNIGIGTGRLAFIGTIPSG